MILIGLLFTIVEQRTTAIKAAEKTAQMTLVNKAEANATLEIKLNNPEQKQVKLEKSEGITVDSEKLEKILAKNDDIAFDNETQTFKLSKNLKESSFKITVTLDPNQTEEQFMKLVDLENQTLAETIISKETKDSTVEETKDSTKSRSKRAVGIQPYATLVPLKNSPLYKGFGATETVSIPGKYTFQMRPSALTEVTMQSDGEPLKPSGGSYKRVGFQEKDIKDNAAVYATNMGVINGRWIDVRMKLIKTNGTKGSVYVGVSTDPNINYLSRLFAVSSTKIEPTFRFEFFDHETKEPVDVGSGHLTYGNLDNSEYVNIRPEGGSITNVYALDTTKLRYDSSIPSEQGIRVNSLDDKGVNEKAMDYWFTVVYENSKYLDIQYDLPKGEYAVILTAPEEFEQMQFELDKPSLIANEDGVLKDDKISFGLYQEIPFRSQKNNFSALSFSMEIPSDLTLVKASLLDSSGADKTSLFEPVGNTVANGKRKLTFVAKSTTLNSLLIHNNLYQMKVETKMDPAKDYDDYWDGPTNKYKFPTTGFVEYKNKGDLASRRNDSNNAEGIIEYAKAKINYVDSVDGKKIVTSTDEYGFIGETIQVKPKTIKRYMLDPNSSFTNGTFTDADTVKDIKYIQIEPEVSIKQNVSKNEANIGDTVNVTVDLKSTYNPDSFTNSRKITLEFLDFGGNKIRSDMTYVREIGSSYDYSHIPKLADYDKSSAEVTSNATGVVGNQDIKITYSNYQNFENLKRKTIRLVDENNNEISSSISVSGKGKVKFKAPEIEDYFIKDNIDELEVDYTNGSIQTYTFVYRKFKEKFNLFTSWATIDSSFEQPAILQEWQETGTNKKIGNLVWTPASRVFSAVQDENVLINGTHTSSFKYSLKVAENAQIGKVTELISTLDSMFAESRNWSTIKTPKDTIKIFGSLRIASAPNVINFGKQDVGGKEIEVKQPQLDSPIIISDTRATKTKWVLTAKLTQPLKKSNGREIHGAIKYYKGQNKDSLSIEPTTIMEGKNGATEDSINISNSWTPNGDGLKLKMSPAELKELGKYQAKILWQLAEVK